MGCADIIPGVSGGTIALITGIYESLLRAIKSIDRQVFADLAHLRVASALERMHLRFLMTLLLGIASALFTLAQLIHYLLDHFGVQTAALFFGLIAASIWFVARRVHQWSARHFIAFFAAAVAAFLLVGMIPVQTPETGWFIFLSGLIGICVMILPGISGAFLLLIMGKYAYLTAALKDPFNTDSLIIIVLFGLGAVVGLAGFSRILSFFLDRYHDVTMAALTGLMAGSLRKIWPWKETLESTVIRGKNYILQEKNVWPADFDAVFWVSMVLFVMGFAVVFALERLGRETS